MQLILIFSFSMLKKNLRIFTIRILTSNNYWFSPCKKNKLLFSSVKYYNTWYAWRSAKKYKYIELGPKNIYLRLLWRGSARTLNPIVIHCFISSSVSLVWLDWLSDLHHQWVEKLSTSKILLRSTWKAGGWKTSTAPIK